MDLEDILQDGSDDSDIDVSAVNIDALLDENDDDEPISTAGENFASRTTIEDSNNGINVINDIINNMNDCTRISTNYSVDDTKNIENNEGNDIQHYNFNVKNAKYIAPNSSNDIDDNKNSNIHSVSTKLESLMVAERRELKMLYQGVQDSVSILNYNREKPIDIISHRGKDNSHSNLKFGDFGKVSNQLRRNTNFKQHGPGIATVIEISSKFIAIGTSKGLVLLFDHGQEIRQVIGSVVPVINRCSEKVTAISLNNAGTLILVGYSTGEITLWDIKGSLLKTITDLHHTSITSLFFVVNVLDGSKVNNTFNTNIDAVSVDAKGVVQKFQLSKHLLWSTYTYEANCLLDGAIGLVSSIAPLGSIYDNFCLQTSTNDEFDITQISKDKSLLFHQNAQLLAVHIGNRTYIIQLQPSVRIVFKWDSSIESSITCLNWNWEFDRLNNNSELFNPLLVRSRGNYIEILSISTKGFPDFDFNFSVKCFVTLHNLNIISLQWVGNSNIAIISENCVYFLSNDLRVIDKCLLSPEVCSGIAKQINENNSLYGSVQADSNMLYILSSDTVLSIHMQSWMEIADQLIHDGKWLEALTISLEKFNEMTDDSLLLVRYIKNYVTLAVTQSTQTMNLKNSGIQTRNHYFLVAGVCIEYCIAANLDKLLFTEIFNSFVVAGQDSVFFDSLETYIKAKKVVKIPANIINSLFRYIELSPHKKSSIDRCIPWLDLSLIDLQFCSQFLSEKLMISSFLYIHAFGIGDFRTAFNVAIEKLFKINTSSSTIDENFPSPQQADIGYKLLLFLKYTGEMRSYPSGDKVDISSEQIYNLVALLISKEWVVNSSCSNAVVSICYPYMYILVKIDAPAMYYCLSMLIRKSNNLHNYRQNHVLENIYCDLFDFTVKYNLNYNLYFENVSLDLVEISNALPENLIIAFIKFHKVSTKPINEAENIVLSLITNQLKCNLLPSSIINELQAINFWRASLVLENKRSNNSSTIPESFHLAINGYFLMYEVEGEAVLIQLFAYLETILKQLSTSNENNGIEIICSYLIKLAEINLEKTKFLVAKYMLHYSTIVIESTNKYKPVQYELFKCMISRAEEIGGKDQVSDTFSHSDMISFISLLLTFSKDSVLSFVSAYDNFPVDECLNLCRDRGAVDATALLLERAGDLSGSLKLLLDEVSKIIQSTKIEMNEILHSKSHPEHTILLQILSTKGFARNDIVVKLTSFQLLNHLVHCSIGLCSRYSDRSNPTMWYTTFEFILKERQTAKTFSTSSNVCDIIFMILGQILQLFMAQMKSFIPAQEIIRRFTSTYAAGIKYEEFKDIMLSMIDAYAWENLLNYGVLRIHENDIVQLNKKMDKYMRRGERFSNFNTNKFNIVKEENKRKTIGENEMMHPIVMLKKSVQFMACTSPGCNLQVVPPPIENINAKDENFKRRPGNLPINARFVKVFTGIYTENI